MEIRSLMLKTSKLLEQKYFYQKRLGFSILDETELYFTIQAGTSKLLFEKDLESNPKYHFAFNIPENKYLDAKKWLIERKIVIKKETFFADWNASALYFNDPQGNIVEFIARHTLKNETHQSFCNQNILNVSEIGIPIINVKDTYSLIAEKTKIPLWFGVNEKKVISNQFITIGDEKGLLILVACGRKWFPTDIEAQIYPMSIIIDQDFESFTIPNTPYKLGPRKTELPF
ncbi:VOC family protein [Candidatus Uabimicrobium sp. HlEnr_7]|uniref:VOC family protein n=1 Tax=Candidatus Uabimicrobium helgolandensis TaxID=3095367 RepID=UPI0035574906